MATAGNGTAELVADNDGNLQRKVISLLLSLSLSLSLCSVRCPGAVRKGLEQPVVSIQGATGFSLASPAPEVLWENSSCLLYAFVRDLPKTGATISFKRLF